MYVGCRRGLELDQHSVGFVSHVGNFSESSCARMLLMYVNGCFFLVSYFYYFLHLVCFIIYLGKHFAFLLPISVHASLMIFFLHSLSLLFLMHHHLKRGKWGRHFLISEGVIAAVLLFFWINTDMRALLSYARFQGSF